MATVDPSTEIPEGFERVNCPSCGGARVSTVREGRDWYLDPQRKLYVMRCESCGFHYTNPRPSESHVAAYYPTDYPPHVMDGNETEEKGAIRSLVMRHAYGSPDIR